MNIHAAYHLPYRKQCHYNTSSCSYAFTRVTTLFSRVVFLSKSQLNLQKWKRTSYTWLNLLLREIIFIKVAVNGTFRCSSNMGSRNLVSLYSSELCRLKKEKKEVDVLCCQKLPRVYFQASARTDSVCTPPLARTERTLAKFMRSFTYNLSRAGFQRRLLSFHLVSVLVNCSVNTDFQHLLLPQCCGYRVTSSHSTFNVHARPVI